MRFRADGDRMLPFVRAFCGQPSSYLWEDGVGEVHSIPPGERGEGILRATLQLLVGGRRG